MLWTENEASRLGTTVRTFRESRELTQEALAFKAGITKNQLQLIEAGRSSGRRDSSGPSNPRLSTLFGLANVLGISIAELMTAAEL